MSIRYGFKPTGAFVVIDDASDWWAVAYPTSDNELRARKDPAGTARLMAADIESGKRILAAQSRRFRQEQRERHAVLSRFATDVLP
jgi:hypothetical protein